MASTKLLNGIPNNILNSYLSTLSYYKCGYMADWIYCGAIFFKINKIEIDIIKKIINPKELHLKSLLCYLGKMNSILNDSLSSNNFPIDFIKHAIMTFEIIDISQKKLLCKSELTDINNKIYKSKDIIEYSYDPFDFSLNYKIELM